MIILIDWHVGLLVVSLIDISYNKRRNIKMVNIPDDLRKRYENAGQGHVFDFVDDIADDSQKSNFVKQLEGIEVEKLSTLLEAAKKSASSDADDGTSKIQPFDGPVGRPSSDQDLLDKSRATGMDAISKGQVAAIVLAGGQGTRLGYDGPKGMYDILLPSKRTLFQMISERIHKLSRLASSAANKDDKDPSATAVTMIPFYIMTSPLNHDATVTYFQKHNYFGLGSDNVKFFQQGTLPCMTENDGKIIMETPSQVSMAPDGNGGIYPSMKSSGVINDMEKRGIKYLHVFSIDNALTKPADPVFVGYCINQGADCGNKVVWKAHPHEKVGVIASKKKHGDKNEPCVVEYSEITKEMAEQKDEKTGSLVYGASNICNHFYTLDFIQNKVLPNLGNYYHIARKKIPYYDSKTKQTIKPESTNNGIKLETFIFDIFPLSEKMAVLEVLREEEFAPVKNQSGPSSTDSPDTARELISALSKKWVKNAGGNLVVTGQQQDGNEIICEIAPSTSYAGEGLEDLVKGENIECPFSL